MKNYNVVFQNGHFWYAATRKRSSSMNTLNEFKVDSPNWGKGWGVAGEASVCKGMTSTKRAIPKGQP